MKPAAREGATTHATGDASSPATRSKSLNELASPSSEERDAARQKERKEDDALVERARSGDRAAFQLLFQRYQRRAYAVALGVVKRHEDALDVVQDAFIKVHKHLGTFQGTSSFYTWLYRIVMNLSIDQLRRKRKITEWGDDIQKDDAIGDGTLLPRMPNENPGRTVVRRELNAKIQAALDTLPEYHRAVIVLREVEGLSYEEMAQALEVPKGTIMSRLFHARRKMQEQLQPYLDGELEITE
jgi:RNA polymerase sigma-70 factor, ECF subfamily